MEVLKKDLPGCLFFWGVGLAIGFILLQTKQTNLELGHQDPMLKDLISITWFTQTYPNMMLAKSIYEIFVKFRCMLQFFHTRTKFRFIGRHKYHINNP